MFIKKESIKKLLLLLVGGVLIMTTVTGCIGPSDKKIVGKFTDFVNMFPTEDLTILYDKEGDASELEDGDLGIWTISSSKYLRSEKGRERIGVVIWFNRNTKEAKGTFSKSITKNEKVIEDIEYPIYYDKDGLHFSDKNIEAPLVKELDDFKMMYEYISIGRKYLNTLEPKDFYYNGAAPLYGVRYKLTSEDINIKKIKELYPNIPIDEDNLILSLEGRGDDWETTNNFTIDIQLDSNDDNYMTAMMSFDNN